MNIENSNFLKPNDKFHQESGNNVIYFNNFNTENVFIEKEKLYVNIDGKRKWIKVSKFWMGNKEWKKLETYLFKQDLTRELHG